MSARFTLLPELQGPQALAADPAAHAALSASAGTGKTQVLTARVLRLLLQGARPESILCLTFTKAAAAEMANRIGARLAAWVRLPDKLLRKDLFALNERDDPRTLERARQLFARVLDCPGGLKIQTIHEFAQSLQYFAAVFVCVRVPADQNREPPLLRADCSPTDRRVENSRVMWRRQVSDFARGIRVDRRVDGYHAARSGARKNTVGTGEDVAYLRVITHHDRHVAGLLGDFAWRPGNLRAGLLQRFRRGRIDVMHP